jgi:segregation and condensation protein A
MTYAVKLAQFEGPLDALLQLVEAQELDITDISLALVTDPFVALIREKERQLTLTELADFLAVAARLVYLKAVALLPASPLAPEEGEIDLATQLRTYQAFVELARGLAALDRQFHRSFRRPAPEKVFVRSFSPPPGIRPADLAEAYQRVLRRLEPETQAAEETYRRVVSLEERIQTLQALIQRGEKTSFYGWLGDDRDRDSVIVSFLAVLELVKQRLVHVTQEQPFQDFDLHAL